MSPLLQVFLLSKHVPLSLLLQGLKEMENTKRKKKNYPKLNYPKLQQGETTLLFVYPPLKNLRGVYIGTRGKGARGTTPSPNHRRGRARKAVETAFSRSCQGGARPAACYVWSRLSPVSWIFWFVDLIPWADKISSLRSIATW